MARVCSVCGKSYSDSTTFCLDDGNPLIAHAEALANTMLPAPATVPEQPPTMQGGGSAPVILPGPKTAEGGPSTAVSPPPLISAVAATGYTHATSPSAAPEFVEPTLIELTPGTTVGEYVVEKQIGEGGMGVIFAGRHPIIGKKVAIKVLNPDMAANVAIVQRFIQEARSVNQIGHRNIVDIFSFGRLADGRHYFVMEFLEGVPFARRIQEPMDWTEALGVWLQVCSAVEAAHARGIVHRDLKPDNIFITLGGDGPFVKVLDFGIAKLTGNDTGVAKTSTGVPMGTPLYMSPEQTRGTAVDHRTDIYALGCIFYETVCGETPFAAPSFFEVMSKQLTEPPPPIGDRAVLDGGLNELIFQMLEKEPDSRPATVAEVRERLVELRDLSMKSGQPLFVRSGGLELSNSQPGQLRPAHPTDAEERTGRNLSKKKPPAALDGNTVPEPRDSQEMPALPEMDPSQRAATEPMAPLAAPPSPSAPAPSRTPLVLGAVAGVIAIGVGGWLLLRKPETPPVVVTPPPVTPPPVTPPPVAPQKSTIKVISTESGLTAFLDGEKVAEGGPVLQIPAAPGRHELKVTRPGFLPWSNQVMVVAGEATDTIIKLEPEKAPAKTPGSHKKGTGPATPTGPTAPTGPRDRNDTINPFGN